MPILQIRRLRPTCLGESQSQVSSPQALCPSCRHTPPSEYVPKARADLCASETDTESLEGTGLAQVKQPEPCHTPCPLFHGSP